MSSTSRSMVIDGAEGGFEDDVVGDAGDVADLTNLDARGLMAASYAIEMSFERNFREMHGTRISLPQAILLVQILKSPGMKPSDLAVYVGQQSHSVSGLLNRLEDQHFIQRLHNDPDHRVVRVMITETGRTVAERAATAIEAIDVWALLGLYSDNGD